MSSASLSEDSLTRVCSDLVKDSHTPATAALPFFSSSKARLEPELERFEVWS